MKLLRIEVGGNFSLVECVGNSIPRYAILSHTWGEDNEEFNFGDVINGTGREKSGFRKILFCSEQTAKDELEYFWVDTCCIDKSSSTELQEAINSMFQWYSKAAKCYVYLADVSCNNLGNEEESFRKSRWFTRGWTLQELLAPEYVEFYSLEHKHIGDKSSMIENIHDITGISIQALQGHPLHQFSIEERKSWAANRHTKREEDLAYSLLGIFNIYMPLIYGEGRKNAFARLERKIRKSEDQLFATRSLASSTQQVDYGRGLFSSRTKEGQRSLSERSDMPNIPNVQMSALKPVEFEKDVKATLRYAAPAYEGNMPRPPLRANVVGTLDTLMKEFHGLPSDPQDLETVLRALDPARHLVDTNERSQSQLRPNSGVHGEAFVNSHRVLKENANEKDKASLSKLMRDKSGDAFRRKGTLQQVETAQIASSIPSNRISSISSIPYSWQQLNALEDYLEDKQVQDRVGHEGIYAFLQFLQDLKLNSKLGSQATVNDWLDVTRYDDRYNPTQYFDKQVSSRLKGTCEWILSHPSYHDWISDEYPVKAARVLWIHGPAGHGKTVLCAKLVQYLKAKQLLPVAYFFASPHAQSGGDPSFIIRSWISQIAQLDSSILDLVRGHCEVGGRASGSAIWSLFESIVSEDRSYAFLLDGFDEYSRLEDARTLFLQKLLESTKRTTSRILLTSRDETDIRAELTPKPGWGASHVIYHCKITEEEVRHDVSRFSRSVVDKKLPNKDGSLRQNLAGQLAEKCRGMFLWIKLQQDQLRGGKNAKQLQNIVNNMPVGLEKTYERNWKIIQGSPPEDQYRAYSILRWTTFALRPLTVLEITEALIVTSNDNDNQFPWDEMPDSIDDEYIKSEIIDICGALVEVRGQGIRGGAAYKTVHLIHPSVREYLLSALENIFLDTSGNHVKSDRPLSLAEQHKYLATICLKYFNYDDTWKQHSAQGAGKDNSFMNYAEHHWDYHVTVAEDNDTELSRLVKTFLHPMNKNFEHWREFVETSKKSSTEDVKANTGHGSPLYYAASLNLVRVMEDIWAEDPTQLDRVGGEYGTPLQVVCFNGHQLAFDLLIRWGANVNKEGGKYGVPLNAAIAGGQTDMAKALILGGVEHTLKDPMGRTPLYTAAMNGNAEIASLLIEAGAEGKTTNRYGWTPLNSASNNGHLEVVRLLIARGADIAVANNYGGTPLYAASSNGHVEVVNLLVEKGADIAVANNYGWTPLNAASNNGHVEVVKLLVEKGADITVANNDGWTPLNAASSNGHVEVVNLLVEKGADITVANNYGGTPLCAASGGGHVEVVKLLLENKADITVADNDGWTPLHAASSNGHVEVVKLLVARGADIAVANNNGLTALNAASGRGHVEVVKLLVEKGADIAVANNYGWTPLNAASNNGHVEVVKLLVARGADIAVANNNGLTALNAASGRGHVEVVKLLIENKADITVANNYGGTPLYAASSNGHVEVVNLLVEKGADMTVANNDRWTPLNAASSNGHVEVVNLLVEKGADMTVANNYGSTPLHAASGRGHVEVVKLLVEKGADIAVANNYGWTPLNAASNNGHVEVVNLLVEKGADMTVANNYGGTPLYAASSNGHVQVVKLLVEKGADPNVQGETYGNALQAASYRGHEAILKLLLEKGVDFDTQGKIIHGWTPLHLAARGGHTSIFQFLVNLGLDLFALDAKGDGVLCYASSGGSLDTLQAALDLGLTFSPENMHWSPLHWACRAGKLEVVELLIKQGLRSDSVTISEPQGQWSPLDIAIFYGHEEMLEKLSSNSRALLGSETDTTRSRGKRHGDFECDGCFHDIYGPRFHCCTCFDFDYCLMCKPFLGSLHTNHAWEYFGSYS